MGNTKIDPNMKKARDYIDKDGNILDGPKGQVVKKKETFNINDIPKEEVKQLNGSLESKLESKINSKIEAIIDKKIDDILSRML